MAARHAVLAAACFFLRLADGTALELAPEWRPRMRTLTSGEELWELGRGCPRPASDFDHPPSTVKLFSHRWESDRSFYRNFEDKTKPSFMHKHKQPPQPSAWEVATAGLPSADKVVFFVQADGELSNCTRCLDCRLTKEARQKVQNICKDNADIDKVELVVSSPMSRAIDTAMEAFPGKKLLLDARLIELAGVVVKGKGEATIKAWEAGSLLPEYMRLWVGPYIDGFPGKKMYTATHLMSPPAGDGNATAQRLQTLERLISQDKISHNDRMDTSELVALQAERKTIREQLEAEELPDARFAAFIKDLRQRPEQRIAVLSHRNLLHIGLGEKLGDRHVTRRVL